MTNLESKTLISCVYYPLPNKTTPTPFSVPRITYRVQHSLKREPNLDPDIFLPQNVDRHPVPIRVKQLVRVQKGRDPRERLARQELVERRQILRTDMFRWQERVSQVMCVAPVGERSLWPECPRR